VRILILHNAYAVRGGEDVVVDNEARALRARGHDVHTLIRDSAELHESPLRGAVETLLTAHNPAAARELVSKLRALRPDVVHVHNLFPRWGLSALRTLLEHAVPTVQTLHNFRWLCAPATLLRDGADCRLCVRGNFTSAVRYACLHDRRVVSAAYATALSLNRVSRLAERAVGRFVCVSSFVRQVYADAGFAPGKLVIKGHFVDSAPGAEGSGDGSVLYAGRMSPEKGLSVLLRALCSLPEVTLKVAGEGPERAGLEAGLGPAQTRVRFLGRLSREQLRAELRRSSVCVVPSIGSETFGLTVLEAMACGRPVVATDAGGLPELVRDGVNGWVVPRADPVALADRVRWLLEHPEAARAFGASGQACVERAHLPAPNMEVLESIYRDVVADERRQRAEPRGAG
jgi:glycosyltransferase involved in cell wall biosynthesis